MLLEIPYLAEDKEAFADDFAAFLPPFFEVGILHTTAKSATQQQHHKHKEMVYVDGLHVQPILLTRGNGGLCMSFTKWWGCGRW